MKKYKMRLCVAADVIIAAEKCGIVGYNVV